jgi:hypothetical protein
VRIGAGLDRIVTAAGYKGHNAPKQERFKVYVAGQKGGLSRAIKTRLPAPLGRGAPPGPVLEPRA